MKEVLKKLSTARQIVSKTEIKKEGKNSFSNYDYYTPSQVKQITSNACAEVGIVAIFNVLQTASEYLNATLEIFDVDSGESIKFETVTATPPIKGANITQQIGGMLTYSERYLLMIAFAIADNASDFDAQKPQQTSPKTATKAQLTAIGEDGEYTELYKKVASQAKVKGLSVKDLEVYYSIDEQTKKILNQDL